MNPILNRLNANKSQQNPNVIFNQMMRTNPQFAKFVNDNKGKTPEQIANDYGIDPSLIQKFLK